MKAKNFFSKFKVPLLAILAILAISAIIIAQTITSRNLDIRSDAEKLTLCKGKLNVSISNDGKNFSTKIVQKNAMRYFVKILDASTGKTCETRTDVNVKFCALNDTKCDTAWNTVSPWGKYYISDPNTGIMRIDYLNNYIGDGKYFMRLRPYGQNVDWSDQTLEVIVDKKIGGAGGSLSPDSLSAGDSKAIDFTEYFPSTPGYTYYYKTYNFVDTNSDGTPKTGNTMLQIESPVKVCGINIIPWRFQKDSIPAYWGVGTNKNLRWLIVDPQKPSEFNDYIWAIGDRRYSRDTFSDKSNLIDLGEYIGGYTYQSVSGKLPAYNLGLKKMSIPYNNFNQNNTLYSLYDNRFLDECQNLMKGTAPSQSKSNGGWAIRAEFDTLNEPGFKYNGEVLRIDLYEGNNFDLRETSYYKKGIGVVKIVDTTFNGYAGTPLSVSRPCEETSDCLGEKVNNPHTVTLLQDYYLNQQLNIKLSGDGKEYTDNLILYKTPSKNNDGKLDYYLKVTNFPYTGYLEVKVGDKIQKWLAVKNGEVYIPSDVLQGFQPGLVIPMQFRPWIPNEQFSNETRIQWNNQTPWSNQVVVSFAD